MCKSLIVWHIVLRARFQVDVINCILNTVKFFILELQVPVIFNASCSRVTESIERTLISTS